MRDIKLILIATLPTQHFPKLMKYICPWGSQWGKAGLIIIIFFFQLFMSLQDKDRKFQISNELTGFEPRLCYSSGFHKSLQKTSNIQSSLQNSNSVFCQHDWLN